MTSDVIGLLIESKDRLNADPRFSSRRGQTTCVAFLMILLFGAFAYASPRDRVAVAEAIVWANQNARPGLPGDTFNAKPPIVETETDGPVPLTEKEFADLQTALRRDKSEPKVVPQSTAIHDAMDARKKAEDEVRRLVQEVDGLRAQLAETQISLQEAAWSNAELKIGKKSSADPMRIEPSGPVAMATVPGPVEVTVHMKPWCGPCHRMQRDNGDGDERIHFTYTNDDVVGLGNHAVPISVWKNGSGQLLYWVGRVSTSQLWEIINKPANAPPAGPQSNYSATGAAGTIHAKLQIQAALQYFRQYVGEGNTASMTWDRSSAQLNLFAAKEWTAKDLFGASGRIQLDAPKSLGLPLKQLAFAYRLVGSDIKLDMEPMTLLGLADRLNPNQSSAVGASPVGIIGIDDALLIYQVLSIVRDIFSLLHPSADVVLPDQIAASATLNGDVLTVAFDKPPSVKLVWLFQFNLAVKQVVISDSNVHVDFSGSRWITSRDWGVQ